jgi:hypothetical protein
VPTETLEEFAQPRGTAARRLHEVDMSAGELFNEERSAEVAASFDTTSDPRLRTVLTSLAAHRTRS